MFGLLQTGFIATGGVTSGDDGALHLIETVDGPSIAKNVKRYNGLQPGKHHCPRYNFYLDCLRYLRVRINETKSCKSFCLQLSISKDWIRTSTPLPALPPQSSASTNFATWACAFFEEPM